MQIFNSGTFWFVEGVLFVLVVIAFKVWMEDRELPVPWWKWVLVLAWFALVGFTAAFVGTSLGEGESAAAIRGGALFAMAALLTGVGLWRLLAAGSRGLPDPGARD